MSDPLYPFLSDIDGQEHKHEHNRLVRHLSTEIRDALGYPVKPAEVQLVGADERLSLRARGELWDVVFRTPDGVLWGIELKRLTNEKGEDLGRLQR